MRTGKRCLGDSACFLGTYSQQATEFGFVVHELCVSRLNWREHRCNCGSAVAL
jgi:hypothetical protein